MGITSAPGFRLRHFRIFWRTLGQFPGGLSIRSNFCRDQNIPAGAAQQFIERIARMVEQGLGGRPIETMELAVTKDPRLTLSGTALNLDSDQVLVRWALLYDINKDLARISGGSARDLPSLRSDLEARNFTVLEGIRLQNRLGIAWCTLGNEIDNRISEGHTIRRICDMLGLKHLCWGAVIEFRYLVRSLLTPRKPTTLDAFDSPYFRPSKPSDKTGYAKDLRTNRRGLPELVHEGRSYLDLNPTVAIRGEING